ncbi:MAG: hypothetical protein ACJAU0_000218 [Flavobacteriales bacterium]|jgi:hypothetical protein
MKLVLVAAIFSILVANNAVEVQSCRSIYFSEPSEQQAILLQKSASEIIGNEPLKMAYLGTAKSMLAEYGFNPFSKLNMFQRGTEMIEEAIVLAPLNAEIRVLRLGIQLNAPAFLMYNSHKEADIEVIIEALSSKVFDEDKNYQDKVITYLQNNAPLSEEQQKQISALR